MEGKVSDGEDDDEDDPQGGKMIPLDVSLVPIREKVVPPCASHAPRWPAGGENARRDATETPKKKVRGAAGDGDPRRRRVFLANRREQGDGARRFIR